MHMNVLLHCRRQEAGMERQNNDRGIRDNIEVTLKGQQPWTDAEVIINQ